LKNEQGLHRRTATQASWFSLTLSINPVITALRISLPTVLDTCGETVNPVIHFLNGKRLSEVRIAWDCRSQQIRVDRIIDLVAGSKDIAPVD
jgi:hypothetical protein